MDGLSHPIGLGFNEKLTTRPVIAIALSRAATRFGPDRVFASATHLFALRRWLLKRGGCSVGKRQPASATRPPIREKCRHYRRRGLGGIDRPIVKIVQAMNGDGGLLHRSGGFVTSARDEVGRRSRRM